MRRLRRSNQTTSKTELSLIFTAENDECFFLFASRFTELPQLMVWNSFLALLLLAYLITQFLARLELGKHAGLLQKSSRFD